VVQTHPYEICFVLRHGCVVCVRKRDEEVIHQNNHRCHHSTQVSVKGAKPAAW